MVHMPCRVGLLPRISRPRQFVTNPKPAPRPKGVPAGLPMLRVLRPRPSTEESDDSGDESSMHDPDSPTTSSTLSVRPELVSKPLSADNARESTSCLEMSMSCRNCCAGI
jgi:hypothetical protein